jgi:hypothetical protein
MSTLQLHSHKDLPDHVGHCRTSSWRKNSYGQSLGHALVHWDWNKFHVPPWSQLKYKSNLWGIVRQWIATISQAEWYWNQPVVFDIEAEPISLSWSFTNKKPCKIGDCVRFQYTLKSANYNEKKSSTIAEREIQVIDESWSVCTVYNWNLMYKDAFVNPNRSNFKDAYSIDLKTLRLTLIVCTVWYFFARWRIEFRNSHQDSIFNKAYEDFLIGQSYWAF